MLGATNSDAGPSYTADQGPTPQHRESLAEQQPDTSSTPNAYNQKQGNTIGPCVLARNATSNRNYGKRRRRHGPPQVLSAKSMPGATWNNVSPLAADLSARESWNEKTLLMLPDPKYSGTETGLTGIVAKPQKHLAAQLVLFSHRMEHRGQMTRGQRYRSPFHTRRVLTH